MKMPPELKAKWIQSIKELPLHRSGGYTEKGSLFEDYDRNPSCAACAIGKLYQIIRKESPDIVVAYKDKCNVLHKLTSISDFMVTLPFKDTLLDNWSKIVKVNDISPYDENISDEQAKTRLVAIIEANF